ncbi:hypothetical protein J6590_013921 [Homalodisca vitripennis]|nr:hypothetical protein J6590_013921 [Homalodisca vitripennis]
MYYISLQINSLATVSGHRLTAEDWISHISTNSRPGTPFLPSLTFTLSRLQIKAIAASADSLAVIVEVQDRRQAKLPEFSGKVCLTMGMANIDWTVFGGVPLRMVSTPKLFVATEVARVKHIKTAGFPVLIVYFTLFSTSCHAFCY